MVKNISVYSSGIVNASPVSFGNGKHYVYNNQLQNDFFRSELNTLVNQKSVYGMIESNPNIAKILSKENIKVSINMKELKNLTEGHLEATRTVANGIISYLPPAAKQKINKPAIQQASLLHDFGKVLIPEKILCKEGKLTENEKRIMDLHSELGYQMLLSQNINQTTLNLIKNHHKPLTSNDDINLQVLQLADRFAALKEERVYKDAFSDKKALGILYKDAKEGKIHPQVFTALVNYVKNNEKELNREMIENQKQVVNI